MTGNPVRNIFSDKVIPQQEANEFFGLKEGMKTVFVMGGSLGAQSINEAIESNINFFKEHNLQLIWQTGKSYAKDAARVEEERSNVWSNSFIDRMEYAYAAADLVVSRAGAMAIAELCVVGKPVIFVPYPYASEDHQSANAMELVNKKAALVVKDEEVKTKLFDTILNLVNDEAKMNELKNNIIELSNTNADEIIAAEILNHLK
jgi:UDP-N-acetylglucosamine--N-acetylmuramyl-(pentapeptide) pyrophosphoryl-undecaprenol N-acetylglucosamine transferase